MFENFSILTTPHGVEKRELSLAQVAEHIKLSGSPMSSGGPSRSYSQVAAVFACVRAKAEAMGRLLLQVSAISGEMIESGPLVELAECPNPKTTSRLFWRDTSAYLDLFGRCHWWLTRDALGRPVEAWPVNPLQMKPMCNRATGELVAWRYRAAGAMSGQEVLIPADDVHTLIDPDFDSPDRPFDGLGPRKVAARAISQTWKSDLANEASLDNGVEPGGTFVSPGDLTVDQVRDMKETITDRHSGVMNRRHHMILYGGMDWKTFGTSFADMEFAELKRMSLTDICAAFNCPPPVIGYYNDSNYAHAESSQTAFWTNTIMPRAEWLAEEWTLAILKPYDADRSLSVTAARRSALAANLRNYGPVQRAATKAMRQGRGFYAWFDASTVPAMQKAWLSLAEQVGKWTAAGVPLNDAMATFGLPFKPVPWGDTWFKEIGKVDVRESYTPGDSDPDFTLPPRID